MTHSPTQELSFWALSKESSAGRLESPGEAGGSRGKLKNQIPRAGPSLHSLRGTGLGVTFSDSVG